MGMIYIKPKSSGTNISDATAIASEITTGKTAYIATGKVTGTNVAVSSAGASAVSGDLLTGKTAYVNNVLVNGSMASNSALTVTPSASVQNFGGGYYPSVQVNARPSLTPTAGAGDILSGKTGVDSNYNVVNGSIPISNPTYYDSIAGTAMVYNGWADGKNYALLSAPINTYLNSVASIRCEQPNLIASNIKLDVSIFGITGSYNARRILTGTTAGVSAGTTTTISGLAFTPSIIWVNAYDTATGTIYFYTSLIKSKRNWDNVDVNIVGNSGMTSTIIANGLTYLNPSYQSTARWYAIE